MEAFVEPLPHSSDDDSEDDKDLLDKYDEVDINIHFHCEHCYKVECKVWPKTGWSCAVISCPHYCGMRFHSCKLSEHELMCLNVRVPCLNAGYGCPHKLPRHSMSRHLPQCPASLVVCCSERNRWLAGSRGRDSVTPHPGHMINFNPKDLDVSLALHDQALLNQLSLLDPDQARAATTIVNRRYPALPLHSHLTGGFRDVYHLRNNERSHRSPSLATDEEDLVPGLSGSVCAKLRSRCEPSPPNGAAAFEDMDEVCSSGARVLVRNNPPAQPSAASGRSQLDDYYMHECIHGVHRNICRMCKDELPLPQVQLKSVWRQQWQTDTDGYQQATWVKQHRVAKVRRRGPYDTVRLCRVDDSDDEVTTFSDQPLDLDEKAQHSNQCDGRSFRCLFAPLAPGDLRLDLAFDNYSKHQTKHKNMVTIQCLQVLRRDEYPHHYQSIHCRLEGEGLEGRQLLRRCPLWADGCPYSLTHMTAGVQRGELSFSPLLQAFGLKPHLSFEPTLPPDTRALSQEPPCGELTPPSSLILPTPLSPDTLQCPSPGTLQSPSPNSLRPSLSPCSRDDSPAPLLYYAAPRLTCLPQELLMHILSFLDGFSLSQASLTCKALADACNGLVRERGLVVLYWYRTQPPAPAAAATNDKKSSTATDTEEPAAGGAVPDTKTSKKGARTHWKLGKPVWAFSSSCGPLDYWRVKEGVPSMSDHLRTCRYYHRNTATEKFSYGSVKTR